MIAVIIALLIIFVLVPVARKRRLQQGQLRSPIDPGGARPELPAGDPREPSATQPAPRDAKVTVETLMDDYAEGRISVEEYERRLDEIYKKGQT